MNTNNQQQKNELFEFISSSVAENKTFFNNAPSENLQSIVNEALRKESKVFKVKLLCASVFSLATSLFFCPQLGFGYFGDHYGLIHYFMFLGPVVCGFLCAAFLVTFTSLMLYLSLSALELKRLGRQRFQVLILYTLGVFFLFFSLGTTSISSELFSWVSGLVAFLMLYSSFLPKLKFQI